MLDFQLKQSAFQYGLSEGTDPHSVPFGVLSKLENYVWVKGAKIQKRQGVEQVGGDGITGARRLFTRGTELCAINGSSLKSWSPSLGTWSDGGPVPDVGMEWSASIDPVQSVATVDSAVSATGLLVQVWVAGDWALASNGTLGTAWVQIIDTETGRAVLQPTFLSTGVLGIRVLIIGNSAIVIMRRGAVAPFDIYAGVYDLTTLTSSVAATIVNADVVAGGSGSGAWDACVNETNGRFVVAYNAAGPLIKLLEFDTALANTNILALTELNGCQVITIGGSEDLYVGYCTADATRNTRMAIVSPTTFLETVAPFTVDNPAAGNGSFLMGVCRYDATNCLFAYTLDDVGTLISRTSSRMIDNAGNISTASERDTWFTYLNSRPFMINGKAYIALSDGGEAATGAVAGAPYGRNTTLVECGVTGGGGGGGRINHQPIGIIDVLVGGYVAQLGTMPTGSIDTDGTTIHLSTPYLKAIPPRGGPFRQGAHVLRVTCGDAMPIDMWRSVVSADECYIAGGGMTAYDGRLTFDYGFTRIPFIKTLTTAGGGTMAAGTYLYTVSQEFISNAGILHRSPPSNSVSIATGALGRNTIVVAGYNLETKQTITTGFGASASVGTILPIFRTLVNGSVFHRLTQEPSYNVLLADQTVSTATLVDDNPDSPTSSGVNLAVLPALYTAGGILDDYQPVAGVTQFLHVDRLFQLAGNRREWCYTKTFQDDFGVAPGFNPAFRILFEDDQEGGASMDEKAIFFSRKGIRYMLGLGPGPNGQISDFTTPTKIQSDVGCVNARSICSTPDGILFESQRGIYMLSRSLELVWIGRPVQDSLAAFPIITSAEQVPAHNEVRITCTDADGTYGIVLVYNYVEKQWSTAKYLQDADGNGVAIVSACMHDGVWTFVTSDGEVYREGEETCLDDGVYVPGIIETAWVSAAGPIAYQSIRNFTLTGASRSDHNLQIECAFNSENAYTQSKVFPARSAVTSVGSLEECEISIGKRRKCISIRFKITDTKPWVLGAVLGDGEGPSFETMGFEFGIMKGSQMGAAKKG